MLMKVHQHAAPISWPGPVRALQGLVQHMIALFSPWHTESPQTSCNVLHMYPTFVGPVRRLPHYRETV